MKILAVEDNKDILSNLYDYLTLKGYIVDCADNGLTALYLISSQSYDLIILDIMLPGVDGLRICQTLRKDARLDTPVIMLTAKDQIEDKLLGFQSGADDYLVKPFDLSELLVRIEAILRRSQKSSRIHQLKVADLEFNLDTMSVTRSGETIYLKPAALKLLKKLMQESPNVVKKEILENILWGENLPDRDNLKAHIYLLRNKIDKPYKNKLLKTIHGFGYQLPGITNE